jgi:hypothetical protein
LEQDVRVSEGIASRHYRTIIESETSKREGCLRARSCFFTTPTNAASAEKVTAENETTKQQHEIQKRAKMRNGSASSASKRVSFATNPTDVKLVQCLIHDYEQPATNDELWYSRNEIHDIHDSAKEFAADYQADNPKYIAAILGLSFSFKKTITKKQFHKFRTLMEDCDCRHGTRGLESVIVEITKTFREAHIDMVLTSQRQLHQLQRQGARSGRSGKLSIMDQEALRRASRKTSQPSRQLARKLGEHDTFQAIKAMLMPWIQ